MKTEAVMRNIILGVLLLFSTPFLLHAQQQCAFILAETQDMYDAGLIEQIPEKLSSCLKSGFTREEKMQAYKLIILSYLFDDNIEQADVYMSKFLREFPSYEPVATDPYEFIQLMNTYDTDPIFNIGPVLGGNFTYCSVKEQYSLFNSYESSSTYAGNPGFEAGVQANFKISGNLNLAAEICFYHNSVSRTVIGSDFAEIDYSEQQNRFDIPLGLSYDFKKEGFIPYVTIGIKPGFLIAVNAADNTSSVYNELQVAKTRSDSYIKIGDQRNFLNFWTFAGGGVRYRVGAGYLFADLRINLNVLNQVNSDGRIENQMDLNWYEFYVSDDFLMHDVAFTAGYLISFYNPKKKSFIP